MFHQPGHPFPPGPIGAAATRQGPCFRYAVPDGWQVVEDGQFAVVLRAPDERAITVMVGNAGLPTYTSPAHFLFDKLSRSGLQQIRMGPGRQAEPVFGWPFAWEFDVDYAYQGIPCRGLARCSVAPSYDSCAMAMTWAASEAAQWGRYASWLPAIAGRVEIISPQAFGAAGIARQNLHNSIQLGEQARQNRAWSERQWADVTRQRDESQARNAYEFRQAMGGVQRYDNPYDHQTIDLPTTNAVYWINPITGQIVGDPNPTFDPRTATDADWQPLKPTRYP